MSDDTDFHPITTPPPQQQQLADAVLEHIATRPARKPPAPDPAVLEWLLRKEES